MAEYKNVEHSRPIELLFLFLSTIIILFVVLYLLHFFGLHPFIKTIISLIFASAYYLTFKKRIIKISNFKIGSKWLEINNDRIHYESIESYEIHWMKGADIKIKIKKGKIIRLSSNDWICDTDKFIYMCNDLDKQLIGYNNGDIVKKKTFLDTKTGYYIVLITTIVLISTIIFAFITGKEIRFMPIMIAILALSTLWSGIRKKPE